MSGWVQQFFFYPTYNIGQFNGNFCFAILELKSFKKYYYKLKSNNKKNHFD